MVLYCVIHPVLTFAFSSAICAAIPLEKIRHLSSYADKPLTICFRSDIQNFRRNSAIDFKHCSQYKNTPTLCIKTLQHYIGAGQFQFLSQNAFFHILREVWNILYASVLYIISIILKAQRMLGKHMLFVIFQIIHRNTEYPCCQGAFTPER